MPLRARGSFLPPGRTSRLPDRGQRRTNRAQLGRTRSGRSPAGSYPPDTASPKSRPRPRHGLDSLVNRAGMIKNGALHEMSAEDLDRLLDVDSSVDHRPRPATIGVRDV
jgi:hypothetical protein